MASRLYNILLGAWVILGLSANGIAGELPSSQATGSNQTNCLPPTARYARPSNTPAYTGYYVGGGCLRSGEPRNLNEGTWGWDYEGGWLQHFVWLNWCHGRRCQGGTGSYR